MAIPKEKHTKAQIIRLLDRALAQEETLLESINALEIELDKCQKKAANPRHELEDLAIPGSKISFRLDFYRTEKRGPVKGIIEHLSSRESQSFEGHDAETLTQFIKKYVVTAAQSKWTDVDF